MSEGQFQVVSKYQPAGDQPTAIEGLVQGVEDGLAWRADVRDDSAFLLGQG